MRLARVSLENYRSFVDEAVIELRPLTLLFGYNSAGKSAAVRILPILAASVTPGQNAPLALDSEAARGASFRDLLSKQTSDPTLTFGFEWNGNERLRAQVVIRDLPERQVQIVERITIWSEHSKVEALWDPEDAQPNAESHRYSFSVGGIPAGVFPMAVDGLIFAPPNGQPFTELFAGAAQRLGALGESVHWLNSLRAVPPRTARFGVRPRRMLPDGSNAADFLAHDSQNPRSHHTHWVLFDSDALRPGIPSGQSEDLRLACGTIPHYQLRRRFIESYLTPHALNARAAKRTNRTTVRKRFALLAAFLQLRPEQKHHFNMKIGFEGDAQRIDASSAGDLYDDVPASVRSTLKRGFGSNIGELFSGPDVTEAALRRDTGWQEMRPVVQELLMRLR